MACERRAFNKFLKANNYPVTTFRPIGGGKLICNQTGQKISKKRTDALSRQRHNSVVKKPISILADRSYQKLGHWWK